VAGSGASAVTVDGARSLADSVVVQYPGAGTGPTSDYHVIGFNDFHGTLEAGTNNLYGAFTGGDPRPVPMPQRIGPRARHEGGVA